MILFEWDTTKATSNLKKHGVSFDEAQTVFDNPLAYIFDDEWHSIDEVRELIIGYSTHKRLLIISFTEKLSGIIRIISARKATTQERKKYEEHRIQ